MADVHLPDTYFVLAPLHLTALALLLALVLLAASEPDLLGGRTPRPGLLRSGFLGVAVGLGGAFCMMLVLGQAGMPRRYVAYLPQFTTSFRVMAGLATVGLAAVIPLLLAFLRGQRGPGGSARHQAPREGAARQPPRTRTTPTSS